MPDLKLAKLPDRTPVKLTINITPEMLRALDDYARLYGVLHGVAEPVSELVPAMLASFLGADRGFVKARRSLKPIDA